MLAAAVQALAGAGIAVLAISPLIRSCPIGPSQREYANGAVTIATHLDPPALLDALQAIEVRFGRKRQGQRWRSRTLDLDVVLWSGGCWNDDRLTVPHPEFRNRLFVVGPASSVGSRWRDPISGLTVKQLAHRAKHRVDRSRPAP